VNFLCTFSTLLMSLVGSRKRLLDGGPDPPGEWAILGVVAQTYPQGRARHGESEASEWTRPHGGDKFGGDAAFRQNSLTTCSVCCM